MPAHSPKGLQDQVSFERWHAAQAWEEGHWNYTQELRGRFGKNWIWRMMRVIRIVPKYRGDDWNSWWKKQFDDYRFLPRSVNNAIEVGCGPYTNIRHIIPTCQPNHLFLSDPLIKTYINFKLTFTADAYKKAFCILDDHPLEEIPYRDQYFDLAVMINVLDHVQDATLCMENLIRIIKPGGWLILGQDLTNEEDLLALNSDPGSLGHPIKLHGDWFEPYLSQNFIPTISKILSRSEGRTPEYHYGTLLYAAVKNLGA